MGAWGERSLGAEHGSSVAASEQVEIHRRYKTLG